ncbi:MAG TPA: terminase [Acidobacteriaceae bacterium]|nr:terminase [Acidobacteriaceae bacterium]
MKEEDQLLREQQGWSDRERLLWLGERLDGRSPQLLDDTVGMWLSRTLLRVRDRNGHTTPLAANAAQKAYEHRRGQHNIVLKARQMGISTWIAGRYFLKTITRPGTLTVQVAQNRETAEQMFRMVHRFYEHLPAGLQEGALRASRANAGQMIFPELDSEYRVVSAADENAGRGLTIQNLHCSEVAHWAGDANAILASLRAALAPNGELVLESTANGAQGCFYEEWCNAAVAGTVRHFFPWWLESEYVAVPIAADDWTEEERTLAAEYGLRAKQIGFRRELKTRFRRLAAQEYAENPESCFLASSACVFDLEQVEARIREVREPLFSQENGQLKVWYPAQPGREYIVGIDPAGGGTGGDYACAQVVERRTGLQCAELRAHLAPRELAKTVAKLGREYNDALLAIERNNHGLAVLAYLSINEQASARRMYSGPIYEQRGQAGWLTSAISRPAMLERLGMLLEEKSEIFSSAQLLTECRSFVRKSDGRTEAAAGAHDDCVLAMAIAQAVRSEMEEHSRSGRSLPETGRRS